MPDQAPRHTPRPTPRRTRRHTRLAVALGGLLLALTATACGGGDEEAAGARGPREADVAFATAMIPHHAEALSMVDLTLERPLDPAVRRLAERLREEQGREIETMVDWLQAWGEEVPETMRDHVHAGHDEPGTAALADEEMAELAASSDAEFQSAWLAMMIEHHEDAVALAEVEREEGDYAPAVELAEEIIETQSAEIARLERLLER